MSWLVGADVGASHMETALARGSAEPAYRISRPGTFVKPGKVASAAEAISAAIRELYQESGLACEPDRIVVGAAGTHNETLSNELKDAISASFSTSQIRITTDGAIALEAAFGDDKGIVVCAGSGSIAYARTPDKKIARVGGLGPELADEGSGFAIGRAGLRAAARAADGRLPRTSLEASVADTVRVENLDDLVDWAWVAERPAIAALAEVVCRDAVDGDEVAREIVHSAAVDLAALVVTLAGSFGLYAEIDIACSGGVLSKDSPVRWELVEYLADRLPNATVLDESVDPVSGALAMASRLQTI